LIRDGYGRLICRGRTLVQRLQVRIGVRSASMAFDQATSAVTAVMSFQGCPRRPACIQPAIAEFLSKRGSLPMWSIPVASLRPCLSIAT